MRLLNQTEGKMETYALQADVINGVTETRDDREGLRGFYVATDGKEFYKCLEDCGADQVIVCKNVDQFWFDKINDDYGVR